MTLVILFGKPFSGITEVLDAISQSRSTNGQTASSMPSSQIEEGLCEKLGDISDRFCICLDRSKLECIKQYFDLNDFFTRHYDHRFAVNGLDLPEGLVTSLTKRPFCLVVEVVSKTEDRLERFRNYRLSQRSVSLDSVQELSLVENNRNLDYGELLELDISYENAVGKIKPDLTVSVEDRDFAELFSPELTRPSWNTYFLQLAHLASLRSNCMKRRVGAVIVHNHRTIATGYNGTPSGLPNCGEGGCPRCNDGDSRAGHNLDLCLCLHAEENALLEAGRQRAADSVLYCTTCPCLGCAKKIAQVGIKEVVYDLAYDGSSVDTATRNLFKTAGVKLTKHESIFRRVNF